MHYHEEYVPLATMADAHREWHINSGVPMGWAGCPQDACHPVDDYDYPAEGQGVRCGHCKGRHWHIAEVRNCSLVQYAA